MLRRQLNDGYKLTEQATSEYLVEEHKHKDKRIFQLKPDLLIKKRVGEENQVILDCKWKKVDVEDEEHKYGIKYDYCREQTIK